MIKTYKLFLILLAIPLIGYSSGSYSDNNVQISLVKLSSLDVYSGTANGDVLVGLQGRRYRDSCDLFYLASDSPGYSAIFSMLLSAYYTESTITLMVSRHDSWRGQPNSYGRYCRIEASGLVIGL